VFFIPSFFLTGLILPVDNTSIVSRISGLVLPATHYILLARGVFLKGLDLAALANPIVSLLLIGTMTLGISLAIFKKRIN
jgi:ABC-2 type transport system permease protein